MSKKQWITASVMMALLITVCISIANGALDRAHPERRAIALLRKGEYAEALAALSERESTDANTAAIRLAMRLGSINADMQLLQEYESNWTHVPPYNGAQQKLLSRRDYWTVAIATDVTNLQSEATQFRALYQRGGPLTVPWKRLVLRSRIRDGRIYDAMLAIKGGELDQAYYNVLEKGVMEIAILGTLQQLLGQQYKSQVDLSRPFDAPTFLFSVGAKVKDASLAYWYMSEVVELTKEQVNHPVRSLALRYVDTHPPVASETHINAP